MASRPEPPELVLVAGEALYDLWMDDDDDSLRGRPGGGPFNTARTLGRLGRPAAYLGRLSGDATGRTLERLLAEDGVALDCVVRTEDPTTLALAELGPDGSARYGFYAAGTAAPGLTEQAALAALPPAVGMLHVGTLGLLLEPVATAVEAVVERLAGEALVTVDPNIRPWAIEDPAAYRARLNRVLRRSDLVKVSEDDLAWLAPGRPPEDAARALLEPGPAAVLLTRGGGGTAAITREGTAEVAAHPVAVVDTIGAGDAFSGGLLAWWGAHGLGPARLGDLALLTQAARFASVVAALTCARAGATPPRLEELPGASILGGQQGA